jgi:hypothetical protein
VFCQLSGIDIGPFWAFRHGNHSLVADWHWDAVLAAHGYASVAPVPSYVEMIGQNPPLAEQGLVVVKEPVAERIDNTGFERYRDRLRAVREDRFKVNVETRFQQNDDGITYLPHQWHMLGGKFAGEWRFKETRGLGEFGYVSSDHNCRCVVPVFGLASLLVSSQNDNAQIEIVDEYSGYRVAPILPKAGPQTQALQIPLPGNIAYRNIHISPLAPGICLYRLITRDPQPTQGPLFFDHSILPEPL